MFRKQPLRSIFETYVVSTWNQFDGIGLTRIKNNNLFILVKNIAQQNKAFYTTVHHPVHKSMYTKKLKRRISSRERKKLKI